MCEFGHVPGSCPLGLLLCCCKEKREETEKIRRWLPPPIESSTVFPTPVLIFGIKRKAWLNVDDRQRRGPEYKERLTIKIVKS